MIYFKIFLRIQLKLATKNYIFKSLSVAIIMRTCSYKSTFLSNHFHHHSWPTMFSVNQHSFVWEKFIIMHTLHMLSIHTFNNIYSSELLLSSLLFFFIFSITCLKKWILIVEKTFLRFLKFSSNVSWYFV